MQLSDLSKGRVLFEVKKAPVFVFFWGGCGGFNAGHLWVVSRTISMIYLYLIYQDLIYFLHPTWGG